MNAPPPGQKRRWSFPDWARLVGCAIAVLGFVGYGTWRAVVSRETPTQQTDPSRPPAPPARPATVVEPYRQASDVGGTRRATTYKDTTVLIDFGRDGQVSLSASELGTYGHWQARDRNALRIDTRDASITATLTTDRLGMSAAVDQPGSSRQLGAVTLRRVR